MEFQDILYEKKDGVAFVRMNRPKVLNAFRPLTIDEMRQAFLDAWYDREVGVVVLTGTNGNFCSGGDVSIRGEGGYEDDSGNSETASYPPPPVDTRDTETRHCNG